MFRVRASDIRTRIPKSAAIVLATLVLASALSVAAVYQVLAEYRLLGAWLAGSGPVSVTEIRSLREDIGARIIVRSTALAAVVPCTVATLWFQQRQFAVRRALNQIKLFARDILASMDQGVITTDQNNTITSVNSAAIAILGSSRIVSVIPWHKSPRLARLWPPWPVRSPPPPRARSRFQVDGRGFTRLPVPAARRERPRLDRGAHPQDGAIDRPWHVGFRTAPRDQEPADRPFDPRPVARQAHPRAGAEETR